MYEEFEPQEEWLVSIFELLIIALLGGRLYSFVQVSKFLHDYVECEIVYLVYLMYLPFLMSFMFLNSFVASMRVFRKPYLSSNGSKSAV